MSIASFFTGFETPFATVYNPGATATPTYLIFDRELANYIKSYLSLIAYPNRLPSSKANYPLLTYSVVAGDPILILSGSCGVSTVVIQLKTFSPLQADVEDVSEAVRRLFQDFRGPMGAATVLNCVYSNPRTSYAASANGQDQGMQSFSRDFKFWFKQ